MSISGSLKRLLQRAYVRAMLTIVARALVAASRADPVLRGELAAFPRGCRVGMRVLGTGPSLLTAVLSFFSFNFFLVRPYYTLAVEDPRELLDLVVFLAAALIAGQLAAYARQQAEAEEESKPRIQPDFDPIKSAENDLGTRFVRRNGIEFLDGSPCDLDRKMSEANLIRFKRGDRQLGRNPKWWWPRRES